MPLHPALEAMLRKRAELGATPFHLGTVREARDRYAALQASLPPNRGAAVGKVTDHLVEGLEVPVPVRVFEPQTPARGTIVFVHGGGWVMGTLDAFAPLCRELAAATAMTVASVDYRLAPEHRFPGPLEDVYAAATWAAGHLPAPLVVMGDSSGGNLAAACALRARDQNGPTIALQVLVYPLLQADFTRRSYVECGSGAYALATEDIAWFWDQYVPDHQTRTQPLTSPLAAENLAGLPPAIISVAGYDPVRDDGIAYAERLRQAGLSVTLRVHDDMIHGFLGMIDLIEPANAAVRQIGNEIRARLDSA